VNLGELNIGWDVRSAEFGCDLRHSDIDCNDRCICKCRDDSGFEFERIKAQYHQEFVVRVNRDIRPFARGTTS